MNLEKSWTCVEGFREKTDQVVSNLRSEEDGDKGEGGPLHFSHLVITQFIGLMESVKSGRVEDLLC